MTTNVHARHRLCTLLPAPMLNICDGFTSWGAERAGVDVIPTRTGFYSSVNLLWTRLQFILCCFVHQSMWCKMRKHINKHACRHTHTVHADGHKGFKVNEQITDTKLYIWNPLYMITRLIFPFICMSAWVGFSSTYCWSVRGQNMGLAFDPGRRCVAATARYVRL